MNNGIDSLRELFPSLDQQIIQDVWNNSFLDFNNAFEQLLAFSNRDKNSPQADILDLTEAVDASNLLSDTPTPTVIDLSSSPILQAKQLNTDTQPGVVQWSFESCLEAVLAVVPDVDIDHVKQLYQINRTLHPNIAEFVIDNIFESNGSYPKSITTSRKRKLAEIVEETVEPHPYNNSERKSPTLSEEYFTACKKLLSFEFPSVPCVHINGVFALNRYLLYPTYQDLVEQEEGFEIGKSRYQRLKTARKPSHPNEVNVYLNRLENQQGEQLIKELEAAREDRQKKLREIQRGKDAEHARKLLEEEAMRTGDMFECQCCFSDQMWDQATHCSEGHLFCLDCCRRNAESEIGSGRYKLFCMDVSGCKALFPMSETQRVLSEKTLQALHKNEQADILYQADIEGLTQCPFCDFAAICPSIDIDKEFRCENPECGEISCRHCKEKSHIPKSCEEYAKDNKESMRRTVEEAMTDALLRKCPKCGHKFIKESGCNKIQCSRCRTMMCYVCSQIVRDYAHFNDMNRGGSKNNCPLFENTEQRHENEIRDAERAAIAKIKEANPGITEEEMKVKLSENLQKAEESKIAAAGSVNGAHAIRGPVLPAEFHARLEAARRLQGLHMVNNIPQLELLQPRANVQPPGPPGNNDLEQIHQRRMALQQAVEEQHRQIQAHVLRFQQHMQRPVRALNVPNVPLNVALPQHQQPQQQPFHNPHIQINAFNNLPNIAQPAQHIGVAPQNLVIQQPLNLPNPPNVFIGNVQAQHRAAMAAHLNLQQIQARMGAVMAQHHQGHGQQPYNMQ